MTINIAAVTEVLDSKVQAIAGAKDIDALRTASLDLAEMFRDNISMLASSVNHHEKLISELQTFAMQAREKLTR
ncbi:hypothetical protein [Bordetella trematum]|uniref:hypothetical protein n=1 Tax=Bordetella trematum TaxID=123899 RepID=UPI00046FC3F7|nr:hypothetical protein [Bordetella trematum]